MSDPKPRVVLIGMPADGNSSLHRGQAAGPDSIRQVFQRTNHGPGHVNPVESGGLINEDIDLEDGGDVEVHDDAGDAQRLIAAVTPLALEGAVPLIMGGDHSLTYPAVQALAGVHGPLHILHFDAHPDLYADDDGNPSSHASSFARIMEDHLATELVQLGVHHVDPHEQAQVNRYGVRIVFARDFDPYAVPMLGSPLYVSLDLDVFDPGFAPGVTYREAGGLSPRQVLDALGRQHGQLVGADVVELNPTYDVQHLTAGLAAAMIEEIAGLTLLRRKQPTPRHQRSMGTGSSRRQHQPLSGIARMVEES